MKGYGLKIGGIAIAASLLLASCTSNGMNTFGAPAGGGAIGGGLSSSGSGDGSNGGGTFTGHVSGGLSPVSGATVNLMAAGSETPVATATTASDGSFSFDFTKPSATSLLYVVVSGGNAGGASSKNLELAGIVGSSDKVPSNTEVNELTTAAFSEVMLNFGLQKTGKDKDSINYGAPANISGMNNMIAEWKNLIAADGKLNTSKIAKENQDALTIIANAVAACVETPSSCDSLFQASSNVGGTAASSLLEAVSNMLTVNADVASVDKIARPMEKGTGYPINSTTPLSALSIPLPAAGATIGVIGSPLAAAVDSKGNVWISGKSGLSKIPANGKKPSNYNLGALNGLAIDAQGNLWATTSGHLVEINPSGKTVETFSIGTDPNGLAIDSSGNIWVADRSGSVTEVNGSGSAVGKFSVTGSPNSVAVDSKGNVWVVSDTEHGTVSELSSSGSTLTTVKVGKSPKNIAIDGSGNLWVTNNQSDTISKLSAKGASLGVYPVNSPQAVIIDSDGQIWITNSEKTGSVTEFDFASNIAIGNYPAGSFPAGLAMDGSGNVWAVDSADGKVTKINKVAAGPNTFPYQGPQFASSSF